MLRRIEAMAASPPHAVGLPGDLSTPARRPVASDEHRRALTGGDAPHESPLWSDLCEEDEGSEFELPALPPGFSPDVACALCGMAVNVLHCVDSDLHLCNNVAAGGSASCVYGYVLEQEVPPLLRLLPSSRWGSLHLRCSVTGDAAINNLVLVDSGEGGDLAIIRRSLADPQATTYDLVAGERLAAWVVDSITFHGAEVLEAHARANRRREGARHFGPPLRFADVGEYLRHFSSLLNEVAKHENISNATRVRPNVTLAWRTGLQGPIASLTVPSGADLLRVEESVQLTCPALDDVGGNEPWVAVGFVSAVTDRVIDVTLQECVGGLGSVSFAVTRGYTVTPVVSLVSVERLQTVDRKSVV